MPCYAVATASAQVAQEQLLRLLTPDAVQEPIAAFLRARFPDATVEDATPAWGNLIGWVIRREGWTMAQILFDPSTGQVRVNNYYGRENMDVLAAEISAVLTRLGGLYLQQLVLQQLAPAVTSRQTTGDGALVLRLNL